jgi:hypothetical protein
MANAAVIPDPQTRRSPDLATTIDNRPPADLRAEAPQ